MDADAAGVELDARRGGRGLRAVRRALFAAAPAPPLPLELGYVEHGLIH